MNNARFGTLPSASDAFVAAVHAFMVNHGFSVGLSPGDQTDEFSWRPCQCCGSRLGGSRHDASYCDGAGGEIHEFSICTDCLMFHANGDLPEAWRR